MEHVLRGIYRNGEIILLDKTEILEGDIILVKIVKKEEAVERFAGILGKGSTDELEKYLGEMMDEGSP